MAENEKEDFQFPDEVPVDTSGKTPKSEEEKLEIEVVDDTPAEDQGRKPMKEPPAEVTEDELEQYSEGVKKRIQHFIMNRFNNSLKKIGMDPIQFRLKNIAKPGTPTIFGTKLQHAGFAETLQALQKHPGYNQPLGKNQGRGMACGFWFNFGGQTCTDINVGPDGSVTLTVGTVDVGGSRASLALCVAEELGVPYEQVKCLVADTGTLGHNDMTDGSRGTFSSSMAGIFAARNTRFRGSRYRLYRFGVCLTFDGAGWALSFSRHVIAHPLFGIA